MSPFFVHFFPRFNCSEKHGHLFIFMLNICSLFLQRCVLSEFCVCVCFKALCVLSPYQICDLQLFSVIPKVDILFCSFLLLLFAFVVVQKPFVLICIPTGIFICFYCLSLHYHSQKIIINTKTKKHSPCVSV